MLRNSPETKGETRWRESESGEEMIERGSSGKEKEREGEDALKKMKRREEAILNKGKTNIKKKARGERQAWLITSYSRLVPTNQPLHFSFLYLFLFFTL